MAWYLLRRIAASVVVLLLLSVLIFFAGRGLVPGSIASVLAGSQASAETIAQLKVDLGLDQPIWVQYLDWLSGVVRGDLGTSPISGLEVRYVLRLQAPVSVQLALMGLVIALVIGIPLGVVAARRAGSFLDAIMRIPMIILFAMPAFITGTLAILLATEFLPALYSPTYIWFAVDPVRNLQTMILPALAVGIPTAPLIMQMTRAAMLEVLNQPYVKAARINGIPESAVIFRYALRPALPPILTFTGYTFGMLIGGLIIVEQIFSLPGLGRGLLESISSRDFVQLSGQAIVLAGGFILANLVVDLVIPLVDKRVVRR